MAIATIAFRTGDLNWRGGGVAGLSRLIAMLRGRLRAVPAAPR